MMMVKRSQSRADDDPDGPTSVSVVGGVSTSSGGNANSPSGGSSSKAALKEKVLQAYETLLRGDNPEVMNKNFWNEFFLLK